MFACRSHQSDLFGTFGTARVLMTTPVLLALVLALIMPQAKLQWLALLLLAACALSLSTPFLHRRQYCAMASGLLLGVPEMVLLLLAAACAALLLPLPTGMLLLAMTRLALALRHVISAGFPVIDAALLLGAVLAFPAT